MDTMPVRVLVADDHQVVRAGIRSYLELPVRGIRFAVEEAETVAEALCAAQRSFFDVVLMDVAFPAEGGVFATERILAASGQTRVLALSMFENRWHVRRMRQAGARGYLLKTTGPEALVEAIRAVLNGQRYYSNGIYALSTLAEDWVGGGSVGAVCTLTETEREVLRMISQGLREKEIAQRMYISPHTVRKHREHIRVKTEAHNTAELVEAARRLGLLA